METETDQRTPKTLPANAAMISEASELHGVPHKGWYFAVMVRAAYNRLEATA